MGLYFGETEITKLHNLAPQSGLDITGLWFGETNVYTVWQVYEGTLPATINANGADMRQYQIYGNTGGVGDRTDNIYNTAETTWSPINTMKDDDGIVVPAGSSHYTTNFTPCKGNTTYTFKMGTENSFRMYFYDQEKSWISRTEINTSNMSFLTPPQCAFLQIQCYMYLTDTYNWEIFEGFPAPTSYVPYGYEVDMSVSDGTTSTTTPVYIGDTALQKDEYVDYQAGKIYRMIDGTLTPTEPPVPLPALPTVDGATIVDYAGQSQAVPEKVLLKYRKEGY